jgi:hypothetical protein
MLKLFLLFGITAVTRFPLQINAQTYQPTYAPTTVDSDPTYAPTNGDSDVGAPTNAPTTTDAPTKGGDSATGIPTLAPSIGEASTPTKSPEIAAVTPTPTTATAGELSCPASLSNTFEIDSISTLFYAIVPSNPPESNNGIFCGKLIADTNGWIGIGISPNGEMSGSVAIVGLPDDNSILKYSLGSGRSVNPMSEEQQTLRDTSITQQDGQTIITFTKLLVEQDELPILTDGSVNIFIHARGMSNTLGYHGSRISFQMDFGGENDTTSSSSPTLAPSTLAPVAAPKPWNDGPTLTSSPTINATSSSPTISSNSTTSPTAATSTNSTETYSPTPLPTISPKYDVSALQASPTTMNGASSSLVFMLNHGGFVPPLVATLLGLYFVY